MSASSPPRKRIHYAALIVVVMVAGLASRSPLASALPSFIATYAGDTLWALMVFLGFGVLFPTHSALQSAALALLFAFSIEFSQFYQAPWINSLRETKIGGLILGFGFRASDLICYAVGISFGYTLEHFLRPPRSK